MQIGSWGRCETVSFDMVMLRGCSEEREKNTVFFIGQFWMATSEFPFDWKLVDASRSGTFLWEFGVRSDACVKISSVYNHLLITWINGRIRWENMINASYGGWTCLDCIWFLHLLKLCSKALFRKEAHCSERRGLLQVHASIMLGTALQSATPCKLKLTNPLTDKEKVTVFI